MHKNYYFLSLISVLLACSNIKAQVTIGGDIEPIKGSLLDLKENTNLDVNSLRGLGLPRVVLKSLQITDGSDNLATTIDGASDTWDPKRHTGLTVYNVADPYSCEGGPDKGVYTWNGEKWLPLWAGRLVRPQQGTGTDVYDGANTYVLAKGNSISIPVKRAFQIWEDYGKNSSDITTGEVLPALSSYIPNYENGTLSVDVVWEEASDGLTSGVLSSAPIAVSQIPGFIEESSFIITAGNKTGNALLALKIGSDVIWQWQIWVPEDDPTIRAYGYKADRDNDIVYWYMDRDLGATDTEQQQWTGSSNGTGGAPALRSAHGLYYQWGRPTPIRKFGTNVPTFTPTPGGANPEQTNLIQALFTPNFILSGNTLTGTEVSANIGNTNTEDWYSDISSNWNTRWITGDNNNPGNKTAFDPCPKGWRLPARKKSSISPWQCLQLSVDRYLATISGYDFTDMSRELGYYAISGYRVRSSGFIYDLGNIGTLWSGTPVNGSPRGQRLFLNPKSSSSTAIDKLNPASSSLRANAISVRCVQDNF